MEKVKKAKELKKRGEVLIDGQKHYSAPKFSELSGVPKSTIRCYIKEEKLKYLNILGKRIIPEGELEKIRKVRELAEKGEER